MSQAHAAGDAWCDASLSALVQAERLYVIGLGTHLAKVTKTH